MKNIKDIVIGIFAVIGFGAVVTGFTNEAAQELSVPESHIWEVKVFGTSVGGYLYNKQTGDVFVLDGDKKKKVEGKGSKTKTG